MTGPEIPESETRIRPAQVKARSQVLITDSKEVFASVRTHIRNDRISVGAGAFAYRWHMLPIERPSLPNLYGWFQRLSERPAFKQRVMLPLR